MAIAFISHSSAQAEEDQINADVVRGELEKRLRERGWDVRVDDRLIPGTEWRSDLFRWLSECDVAVFLVNRDGLTSSWLRREVEILMYRRAMGMPVTVVPVLLSGLTPKELRRSEISRLADLQLLLQDDPGPGGDDLVSRIVTRLGDMGSFPDGADALAMRSMTGKIVHCLSEVDSELPLRNMARALGAGNDWPFPTAGEGRRFIAHRFRGPVPTEKVPPVVTEAESYLAVDRLQRFISLVLPTWIDPADARPLLPGDDRIVATLAAAQPYSAEHHVHRASCAAGSYWVETVPLVAGEAQQAEYLEMCRKAVCALLKSDDEDDLPLEGEVLFLVIDPHGTDLCAVGQLVRTLTTRFAWLNVIVLTEDADPAGLGEQAGRTVHVLLQPGVEKKVARTKQALEAIVARRRKGYGEGWAS